MNQADLLQGPVQTPETHAATRATPSGSDLRIYKLGRGAVKLKPGTQLAQASVEPQGGQSPQK